MPEQVILLKPLLLDILSMPLGYVVIGVLVVLFGLLIALLIILIRHHMRISAITEPVRERTVSDAQKKAQEIVWKAMEEARKLRVESELSGIKTIAKDKKQSHEIFERYKEEISDLVEETQQHLSEESSEIEERYKSLIEAFSSELKKDTDGMLADARAARLRLVQSVDVLAQEAGKARSEYDQFITRFSQQTNEILKATAARLDKELALLNTKAAQAVSSVDGRIQKAITERLDREFAGIEENIAAYQRARQDLIDNQMLALVEQVAQVALERRLDLTEHADMVENALATAKKDGVFSEPEKDKGLNT